MSLDLEDNDCEQQSSGPAWTPRACMVAMSAWHTVGVSNLVRSCMRTTYDRLGGSGWLVLRPRRRRVPLFWSILAGVQVH